MGSLASMSCLAASAGPGLLPWPVSGCPEKEESINDGAGRERPWLSAGPLLRWAGGTKAELQRICRVFFVLTKQARMPRFYRGTRLIKAKMLRAKGVILYNI
jgi:hypothetical protein